MPSGWSIASSVPQPVKNLAKGTAVESWYFWVKRKRTNETTLEIETPRGVSRIIAPTHAEDWYPTDNFEWPLQKALLSHFDSETVFYDIGSQFGFYLELAMTAGVPKGRIFGFEAGRERYHRLENEYSFYTNVTHAEVGDGEADTLAIDTFAQQNTPPTVVKIDVEGAEGAVLAGMDCVLADGVQLYVEMHPEMLTERGRSVEEVLNSLRGHGYTLLATNHREKNAEWKDLADIDLLRETWMLQAAPP